MTQSGDVCCVYSAAIIYHCDLTKDPLQPHVFREVTVKGFNPADYQTTQVHHSHTSSRVRAVALNLCSFTYSFHIMCIVYLYIPGVLS